MCVSEWQILVELGDNDGSMFEKNSNKSSGGVTLDRNNKKKGREKKAGAGVRTKRRHSHRYSILATDVGLLSGKYKKMVEPGMETDRVATTKPAPRGLEVPRSPVLNQEAAK